MKTDNSKTDISKKWQFKEVTDSTLMQVDVFDTLAGKDHRGQVGTLNPEPQTPNPKPVNHQP